MRKAKKLRFVHFDFCFVDVVETEKEMENCIGVIIIGLVYSESADHYSTATDFRIFAIQRITSLSFRAV